MLQRISQFFLLMSLAAGLAVSSAAPASADMMTVTQTGVGSGTIGGSAFGPSSFVITSILDTANRASFVGGFSNDALSASISISGVGDFDFLTGTRIFVNNSTLKPGLSRAGVGSLDLYNGPTNAAFAAWDLLTSIGPIMGQGDLIQWSSLPQINTTGGILLFNTASTDTTFTAPVAAVPEPGVTTLAFLGCLGLLKRWR